MTCGEKIELPDGNETTFDECSSDGTSGCCSTSTDCVYGNECYSEDETIIYQTLGLSTCTHASGCITGSGVTEYTFVCSDAHWCPDGFEYDDRDNICQPTQAACYDADATNYPEFCNSIFGTNSTGDWQMDSGCIRPSTTGTGYYNESCVYSGTYGGMDYYFYQDIIWY